MRIAKIINWIKSHKLLTALFFMVTLTIYFKLSTPDIGPKTQITTPTPSPISIEQETIDDGEYFINSTNSQTGILDYSWHNGDLYYITPKGVYQAGTNVQIIETQISQATSENNLSLYNAQGSWKIYNLATQEKKEIDFINPFSTPIISGDNFYSYSGKTLQQINSTTLKSKTINIDSQITKVSVGESFIAIETPNAIKIYNSELQSLESLQVSGLLDIDDQAYVLSEKNNIVSITNSSAQFHIAFKSNSSIQGKWIFNKTALIIETEVDSLGRKLDHIWAIGMDGSKTLLSSTQIIPYKLRPSQPLKPNPLNTLIPLIDRSGKLWLLGLQPNKMPAYGPAGEITIDTSNFSFGDDH